MKRLLVGVAAVLVALATVGVAPASAHEADVIHIKALQSASFVSGPGTPCPVPPGALVPPVATVMSGSLVGCWYIDQFNPTVTDNGNKTYTLNATGLEHFVGCITTDRDGNCRREDRSSSWQTTFTFTGIFYYPLFVGAEISGGCTHPIVPGSGTGDFKGVRGTIFMTDNVNNGTSNVTGSVVLRDE